METGQGFDASIISHGHNERMEPWVMLSDEENWPVMQDTSEAAWEEARGAFRQGATRFTELLHGWSDEGLRETIKGRGFTYKVLVHGVAHHNVYHAAQIALVKKWVS